MRSFSKPFFKIIIFSSLLVALFPSCNNKKKPVEKPEVTEPVNDSLSLRHLTGTVTIVPVSKSQSPQDYWLYLNGNIVDKYISNGNASGALKKTDLVLLPGQYKVEVVVVNGLGFPYSVRKEEIAVSAGENKSIKMNVSNEYGGMASLLFSMPESVSWDEWIEALRKNVVAAQDTFRTSAIINTFNRTYYNLANSPPQSKNVYISLPEEYCGAREYDAVQIRKIIAWIKEEYINWFLPKRNYPNMPSEIELQYDRLQSVMTALENYCNDLNKIADKLDKAEGS
jgi:hypothetical protein